MALKLQLNEVIVQDNKLTSANSTGNIELNPAGTGTVKLGYMTLPGSAGSDGTALEWSGANLTWGTVSGGVSTNYAGTGQSLIHASNATTLSMCSLAAGTGLSLSSNPDGTITLSYTGGGTGGATAFTGLSDVPSSYTGAGYKLVRVNTGASALEFATLTAGTGISVTNAAGTVTIANTSAGTVTSVGLALPGMFTVTGSPVTTSGLLTGTLASQAAHTVLIAPIGSAGAPTFRILGATDLGTGTASTTTFLRGDMTWAVPAGAITTQDEGTTLSSAATTVNFVGAGVTASGSGATTTVTIPATVSSVGLTVPAFMTAGAAITTSGNIDLSYKTQNKNLVFASSGTTDGVAPTFRALVAADISAVNASAITGIVPVANLGTGTGSSSNYLRGDGTWSSVTASWINQAANTFFAGPTSSTAQPAFRKLDIADINSADTNLATKISPVLLGGTINADSSHYLTGAGTWATVSGGGGVATQQAGVTKTAAASTLNFTGAGVTVTDAGSGVSTINIPGGSAGGAQRFNFTIHFNGTAFDYNGTPFPGSALASGSWTGGSIPAGWSLVANSGTIVVTHTVGNRPSNMVVFGSSIANGYVSSKPMTNSLYMQIPLVSGNPSTTSFTITGIGTNSLLGVGSASENAVIEITFF